MHDDPATSSDTDIQTRRAILLSFYPDLDHAQEALNRLVELDAPLDRVSILGRASGSGDDPLGVYYPGVGERMKGWGGMGALWGGIWGLVAGAAGIFVFPGLGAVAAAGPVVNALASGAGSAAVVGGAMAGAGAIAQFTVAVHRHGVPEERLEETRERISRGEHLIMLILGADETGRWRDTLAETGGEPVWELPYVGFREAAAGTT